VLIPVPTSVPGLEETETTTGMVELVMLTGAWEVVLVSVVLTGGGVLVGFSVEEMEVVSGVDEIMVLSGGSKIVLVSVVLIDGVELVGLSVVLVEVDVVLVTDPCEVELGSGVDDVEEGCSLDAELDGTMI